MKPELRWSRISNARVGRTFLSDKCLQDSCSGHFCHCLGLKQEQQQDQDQKRRTGMSDPHELESLPCHTSSSSLNNSSLPSTAKPGTALPSWKYWLTWTHKLPPPIPCLRGIAFGNWCCM